MMKNIFKVQGFIFLLLTIIAWIVTGSPLAILLLVFSILGGPYFMFTFPQTTITYIVLSSIFLFAIVLMVYGYRERAKNRGTIIFTIGFWIWAFLSFMSLAQHA